jgi:hypothetical protein
MPLKSKAQRRYLHATNPTLADKFEEHTPKGKKLPERVSAIKQAEESWRRCHGITKAPNCAKYNKAK